MTSAVPERATDVLVIGGGIAGAALLHELAIRGADACLLDAGVGGTMGASSVPAALVNPHRGRSARSTPQDEAGASAFWDLVRGLEAVGRVSGAHRSGVLRIADKASQARAWQRLVLDGTAPSSAALQWLPPPEVPGPYHAPFGALLVEDGGWVIPAELLHALEASAAAHGTFTARGVTVTGLESTRDGVSAHTNVGSVAARRVVLCVGAERPAWLRLPRLETVWGQALVLRARVAAPYPLAGSVVAAFGADHVVVSGGHDAEPTAGEGATLALTPLARSLTWQVPELTDAEVERRWIGARVKRPSGQPVARRLSERVHFFGAFGGRGFLRAAAEAARFAALLLR